MKLHEVIRNIINDWGADIILQPQFVNIIADMHGFESIPAAQYCIKLARNYNSLSNIHKLYTHSSEYDEQQIRRETIRLAEIAANRFAMSKEVVTYCFDSIIYGLSLVQNINDITIKTGEKSTNIIGHWDFYYRDGKKITIIIKPDGTALTSLNNTYRWKAIRENEILIYLEGLVSYRGVISGDRIEGNAYSEQYGRNWPWWAERKNKCLTEDDLLHSRWIITNECNELQDNEIDFLQNGTINSSIYEGGTWSLDDGILSIETANAFLYYEARYYKGVICGEAHNIIGNKWNFKLQKIS